MRFGLMVLLVLAIGLETWRSLVVRLVLLLLKGGGLSLELLDRGRLLLVQSMCMSHWDWDDAR
jgi:hypothetical protein